MGQLGEAAGDSRPSDDTRLPLTELVGVEQLTDSFDLLLELAQKEDTNNASNASPDRSNVAAQIALALAQPVSSLFTPEAPTGGTPAPSVEYNAVHSNTLRGPTVGHLIEYATPDPSRMRTPRNGTPVSPLDFTECMDPVKSTVLPMDPTSWLPTPREQANPFLT